MQSVYFVKSRLLFLREMIEFSVVDAILKQHLEIRIFNRKRSVVTK